MTLFRRWRPLLIVALVWVVGFWYMMPHVEDHASLSITEDEHIHLRWKKMPETYPVSSTRSLPTIDPATAKAIPKIQSSPPHEDREIRNQRLHRKEAVREAFKHSWGGYKKHAWMHDEVKPITGEASDPFAGWAATLVDSLDTLWVMGMHDEFEAAVKAAEGIDFTRPYGTINVFETNIRYLGGFLAAYELSGKKYKGLLTKAVEVGELLMSVFDTPNRMPIPRWNMGSYLAGRPQATPSSTLVSELGSLSLEFTKLSQLTSDMKYYDAVQRISDVFENSQNETTLPGMWPVTVNSNQLIFNGNSFFTLGGMSDSLYEYLPKQYLLLGGALPQSRTMYEQFIEVAKEHLFRRALNPKNEKIIISGDAKEVPVKGVVQLVNAPKGQHLTCFVAGMLGIAAKIFGRDQDLPLAIQVADGCVWSYDATPTGIGPEVFTFVPCASIDDPEADDKCVWTEEKWMHALKVHWRPSREPEDVEDSEIEKTIQHKRIPKGMVAVSDKRYILRPEAIESVFIMYRITGDRSWMDKAWRMFEKIQEHTETDIAASAIDDVTQTPHKVNNMESFWLAETLKYFYLVFSEWDVVDLDEWVLNTEAHPLRRPDVGER